MAWDSARPVPWKRLIVPFAVYAVVATAAFSLVQRSSSVLGIVAGVAMGGALYLVVAVVLVKFGWNPPQWGSTQPRQRADGSTAATGRTSSPRPSTAATADRAKPSPTARTNAGNHRAKRSR